MIHTNIFEEIKNRVDIIDAAERFGVQVDRHNKALCFVHSERNPSLSFRNNRYKCFSCNTSGDVIEMICQLKGVKPIEAAKILNSIYGLNLFDKKTDYTYLRKQLESEKAKLSAWNAWELRASIIIATYLKQLDEWKRLYAPKTPDEPLHPLFVESLNNIAYWDYVYQSVFIEGSFTEKTAFYKTHAKAVDELDKTRKVKSA